MTSIYETCGCGADFHINDPEELWTTAAMDEALTNWRTTHLHTPVAEAGRCTNVLKFTNPEGVSHRPAVCRLRYGHTGGHEDDDGATWFRRDETTNEENS